MMLVLAVADVVAMFLYRRHSSEQARNVFILITLLEVLVSLIMQTYFVYIIFKLALVLAAKVAPHKTIRIIWMGAVLIDVLCCLVLT